MMVESIYVENFRCFERLEIHGLKRINVVVGKNASGKTTLLESIFLAAGGGAELVLRLRNWRGMGDTVQLSADRKSYESLWQDLFFSVDQSRNITVSLTGSEGRSRTLTITYNREASLTLPLDKQRLGIPQIAPITFEWTDESGKRNAAQPTLGESGLNLGGSFPVWPAALFASSVKPNPAETATRFSELSKRKKENSVVDAFRQEFPYIQDLSLEVNAGTIMVYASVQSLPEKLPVALVSDGANKLISILAAIANYEGGVVLVDEVDNGFYFDRLASVWRILLRSARENNVQVFVTTHNRECLNAIGPSLEGNEDEFCLVRTEKVDGKCRAVVFGGRDFKSAIQQEAEVR